MTMHSELNVRWISANLWAVLKFIINLFSVIVVKNLIQKLNRDQAKSYEIQIYFQKKKNKKFNSVTGRKNKAIDFGVEVKRKKLKNKPARVWIYFEYMHC